MASTIPVNVVRHMRWQSREPYGPVWGTARTPYDDLRPHEGDFVEIDIISSGTARHESIYGPRPVARGDAILVAPGSWQVYRDCHDLRVSYCAFSMVLLERELGWLLDEPLFKVLQWTGQTWLRLPEEVVASCEELLASIEATLVVGPPFVDQARAIGKLVVMLSDLIACLDDDTREALGRAASAHPAVTLAARLLRDRYDEPWRVERLAAEVALDAGHLSRIFTRDLGVPPIAYLTRIRVEAAATLLLRTRLSVTAIGAKVGWSDPSYFARRFRAHFGLSPTAYRAQKSHAASSASTSDLSLIH